MENPSQNKDGLLNRVLEKYKKCQDESFLHLAVYHLGILEKYLKLLREKGQAAFPTRVEYQKFQIAKLFIDKMSLLEFSPLKEFEGYKDSTLAPLDAFSMTLDVKETRKIKFLKNIDKGQLLHLKVVENCDQEYKLLVLNKYNENERVCDYFIYAHMLKAYQSKKLPRPLQINDLVRAAVLGKLKMEGNSFSKLLVTMNDNIVRDQYKDVSLGLVLESDIPFYPKDISNCSSFMNYMITNKSPEDPQDLLKCMSSLGIDPYKTYSFHEISDGKKLGVPQEPSSAVEFKEMDKSMNIIKEAEKRLVRGEDPASVLPMLEESIKICPENDVAFAMRGQVYKAIFMQGNEARWLEKALNDFQKALTINGYNLIATREYLTLILISCEEFQEEGNTTKVDEIRKIIARCKDICDVTPEGML